MKQQTTTVHEALALCAQRLQQTLHNRDQAWAEAEILMAHALKKERAWTLAHADEALPITSLRRLRSLINRRMKHEPMAYLLGYAEFYGHRFKTDKRALIPRPETEELVALALDSLSPAADKRPTLFWDVGTGCGAIAVTLKREAPNATVIASEMDRDALTLARRNLSALLQKGRVVFFRANLMNRKIMNAISRHPAKRLVVVANLPYLPSSDKRRLAPDVVRYEPARALFTKEGGRFLIRRLLEHLARFHKTDGRPLALLAEFDPPQAKPLASLARRAFPQADVRIIRDTCGRDRFLSVTSD